MLIGIVSQTSFSQYYPMVTVTYLELLSSLLAVCKADFTKRPNMETRTGRIVPTVNDERACEKACLKDDRCAGYDWWHYARHCFKLDASGLSRAHWAWEKDHYKRCMPKTGTYSCNLIHHCIQ